MPSPAMEEASPSNALANGHNDEPSQPSQKPLRPQGDQSREHIDQSQRLHHLAAEVRDQDELERNIGLQASSLELNSYYRLILTYRPSNS